MAFYYKPKFVNNGLVMALDPANHKSYPGSGNVLYDLTNGGRNTTFVGDTAYNSSAKGCLSFDGTGDYTTFNSITLSRSGAAMSWWMAPSTIANMDLFGDHNDNGYLRLIEFRQTYFYAETNSNCNYFSSPSFTAFTANEWRNVCVVFSSNLSTWYIDGQSIGSTSNYGSENCSTPVSNMVADTTFSRIATGGYSGTFNGKLSHISIHNRALTASEVEQNYEALKTRFI